MKQKRVERCSELGRLLQGKEIERLNKVYTTILKNAGVEVLGGCRQAGRSRA